MELNKVILAGNLTKDPELRELPSGMQVCSLRLASNRRFIRKEGQEVEEETCYIDITVWGKQGEVCNEYLEKGRPIIVDGRIKYEQWEDKEGNPRSKHSIVADRVHFGSKGEPVDAKNKPESESVSKEEVPF